MNIADLYEIYKKNPSVQTDTRKLQPGDIFFALKGPNFNGNTFAARALEMGAAAVIADEDTDVDDGRIIRVDDSLQSLQALAGYHRDQLQIPMIAITGSNGKTTTKELTHAVLSTTYSTYTTEGNLNNHIGVPLTLLKIKQDAQMAIVEMGANHQREIESYCMYARPDYGLITNIGKAHLEGFGGEAGVRKGKGELFKYLGEHGGTAFVNMDDRSVVELSASLSNKIPYGSRISGHETEIISSDPFLHIAIGGDSPMEVSTNLVGGYNLSNLLAAIVVGRTFNVPDNAIRSALESYTPSNSRSQMIKSGNNTIILDAYNANPGSMKAAVENFAAMHGDRKVLVLGDMKELGTDSRREHEALIDLIQKYSWTAVALTGPVFSSIAHPYHSFSDAEEACHWYRGADFKDALILVKGSRSMQMEKVVEPS